MRKKIFFMLSSIFLVINGLAQEDPSIINSSGGSASYNEMIFDWSVGEMASVETFTSGALMVTQGFLQSSKSIIDQVDQIGTSGEKIKLYPDIEKQICNLETSFEKPGKLNYLLVDLNGRIILKKELNIHELNSEQTISLLNYSNGIYLLKVSFTNADETFIKTFKIRK